MRKHDAYFAATPRGLIESGVTHCDPVLSPYGPPAAADARGITALALERVAEHASARTYWRIGDPYEGRDVSTIRVRSQRPPGIATPNTPESALTPAIPGHRRWGSMPAAAPNAIDQLAAVVADALKSAGGITNGAGALRITPDSDGWVRYELDDVTTEDALRFSAVFDELLAPLTEPRHLIGRKILTPPTGRLARSRFAARVVVGLPLPGAVAWHPVPRWFGQNQKRLGALLSSWERLIGPPRLTRADSPDGQAILDLFRGDNPLSITTQLRTTWQWATHVASVRKVPLFPACRGTDTHARGEIEERG